MNLEPAVLASLANQLALQTHLLCLLSARMSGSGPSCADFRWGLGTQILVITLMWQIFLPAEPFPQPRRDAFLNVRVWHAT